MKAGSAEQGMGVIVRTVSRWLKGFILTYGIYVILYGHVTPGGGFAGGVIIACGFILLTLAGGEVLGLSHFSRRAAATLDSAGVLLFLALACAGMVSAGGAFFENFVATPESARFTLLSAGTIPVSNISLGLKVASSLFLAFTVLAAFRIEPTTGDRNEGDP